MQYQLPFITVPTGNNTNILLFIDVFINLTSITTECVVKLADGFSITEFRMYIKITST